MSKTTNTKSKNNKFLKKAILISLAVFIIGIGGFVARCMMVSRPALHTAEEYLADHAGVSVEMDEKGSVILTPSDNDIKTDTGIIFYVGAQIDPEAYIPLFARLAEQGISCYIPKIAGNVASFGAGSAEDIIKDNIDINSWYLSGHSLGGYTAAAYVASHTEDYDGLILIAAYSGKDLKECNIPVLSIYGDRDGVLSRDRYEKGLALYGDDFEEFILDGGNHSGYADYGSQPKDNDAGISPDEQQKQTADLILDWIERH